jgi:hypothetical protein
MEVKPGFDDKAQKNRDGVCGTILRDDYSLFFFSLLCQVPGRGRGSTAGGHWVSGVTSGGEKK